MLNEKGAFEEETSNWVLLKKTGQKFGRNAWKTIIYEKKKGTTWWKLMK